MKGRLEYLEIPPLSLIFISYIITSFYFPFDYFGKIILWPIFILPALMFLGFGYIIYHWIKRKNKNLP